MLGPPALYLSTSIDGSCDCRCTNMLTPLRQCERTERALFQGGTKFWSARLPILLSQSWVLVRRLASSGSTSGLTNLGIHGLTWQKATLTLTHRAVSSPQIYAGRYRRTWWYDSHCTCLADRFMSGRCNVLVLSAAGTARYFLASRISCSRPPALQ